MSRSIFGVLAAAAATGMLTLSGCSSGHPGAGAVSTSTSSTTSTTATTVPPTTVWAPTAPQRSPDAAAARLVSAWSTGDRALAGSVAAPGAVGTLFSQPYPAGYLQGRGCTEGANPGTCTYRNTRTNGIYEIDVASGASGWYVSGVRVET